MTDPEDRSAFFSLINDHKGRFKCAIKTVFYIALILGLKEFARK